MNNAQAICHIYAYLRCPVNHEKSFIALERMMESKVLPYMPPRDTITARKDSPLFTRGTKDVQSLYSFGRRT
jgi:hypothetical protein